MKVVANGRNTVVSAAQCHTVLGLNAHCIVFTTTRVVIKGVEHRVAVTTRDHDPDAVTLYEGLVTDDYIERHLSKKSVPLSNIPMPGRAVFEKAVFDAQGKYIPHFEAEEKEDKKDAESERA